MTARYLVFWFDLFFCKLSMKYSIVVIAVIQSLNTSVGLTVSLEEGVLSLADTMRHKVSLATGRFKNSAFYNSYIFLLQWI